MIVLAIETASDVGSVAVLAGDEVHEESLAADQPQSAALLMATARCLEVAGLTLAQCAAVAVDRGPGSFTGLRVGMGVAQGLAYGAERPIVPVSSLRALAQACGVGGPVLALLDARMREVYWGCFAPDDAGWMQVLGTEQVSPPVAVKLAPETSGPWRVTGIGWERYRGGFPDFEGMPLRECGVGAPRARDIARLGRYLLARGEGVSALAAHPAYLRNQVTNQP